MYVIFNKKKKMSRVIFSDLKNPIDKKKKRKAGAVDVAIGKRLRSIRIMSGSTQADLASKMKITFQQLQKYEQGANRISARSMWDMSRILSANIAFFFPGTKIKKKASVLAEQGNKKDTGLEKEIKKLLSLYSKIDDQFKKNVFTLVEKLAHKKNS